MSVFSCTSPEYILNSPLNDSRAKFHYSIPKSRRFPKYGAYCQQAYYGYRTQLSNVGTRVGTGPRSDFTKSTSVAPGPTLYVVPTKFEKNQEKQVGQTFGLSREALKEFGHVTQQIIANPGVGQYKIESNKPKFSYTMRPKTANKWLPQFLKSSDSGEDPGPGNYHYMDVDISKLGRSFNARYKSVPASSIAKSRRFFTPTHKTPGPCQYTNPDALNDSGYYKVSWNRGNGKRIWSKDERKSFIDSAKKSSYGPGPGQYRQPSDFGHYDYIDVSNTSFYRSQANRPQSNSQVKRPVTH